MKTIDFSYFIERYIAAEMDDSERKWFEKELEGNSSLQVEVKLRRKVDAGLIRHDIIDLRNKLSAIERERKEKLVATGTKRSSGMRFAAAIAALMLLGGGYLLTNRSLTNEALYSRNFRSYQPASVSRSAEARPTDLQKAIELYERNDYVTAASYLKSYLGSNPRESEAIMVYGVSEMAINNFPEAKASFRSILNNADNLYIDVAQWYLALCYVKTHENNEAVKQLEAIIPSNSIYSENARKLLRKIK